MKHVVSDASRRSRLLVAVAVTVTVAAVAGAGRLHPALAAQAGNPLAGGLLRSSEDDAPFTGQVEERLSAGSYTYHAVRRPDGARAWVVTLGAGQPAGARVRVKSYGRRTHFRSNRLDRTFPELLFGVVSRGD